MGWGVIEVQDSNRGNRNRMRNLYQDFSLIALRMADRARLRLSWNFQSLVQVPICHTKPRLGTIDLRIFFDLERFARLISLAFGSAKAPGSVGREEIAMPRKLAIPCLSARSHDSVSRTATLRMKHELGTNGIHVPSTLEVSKSIIIRNGMILEDSLYAAIFLTKSPFPGEAPSLSRSGNLLATELPSEPSIFLATVSLKSSSTAILKIIRTRRADLPSREPSWEARPQPATAPVRAGRGLPRYPWPPAP